MKHWIDVLPSDWYYDEVMEATNYELEDGEPLAKGIPYDAFQTGSVGFYKEVTATSGQSLFDLGLKIVPTNDNPLFVYVDGNVSSYKSLDNTGATTKVLLYGGVRDGGVVSFKSAGIPEIDAFGKPVYYGSATYPTAYVVNANNYYYDMFTRGFSEYMSAFNKPLRRAQVSEADKALSMQAIASKYIGYNDDVYWVSDAGQLVMPYKYNNASCYLTYSYWGTNGLTKVTEKIAATSPSVAFTDRFFPKALISRAEAFTLINRMRRSLYARFSDMDAPDGELYQNITAVEGQRVFELDDIYEAGKLTVLVNGNPVLSKNIVSINDHTVELNYVFSGGETVTFSTVKPASRFKDVDRESYLTYDGSTTESFGGGAGSWWAPHVKELELEALSDGTEMIYGMTVTNRPFSDVVYVNSSNDPISGSDSPESWFMPKSFMTRAQAVTILNRFRKLCIERFL